MKERTSVMIIVSILLLSGILVFYLQFNFSGFNFYKSELTINGSQVQEKLSYLTDKDYHTLYRNFQSDVSAIDKGYDNSVWIKNVVCNVGTPYFNTRGDYCYIGNFKTQANYCLQYTEPNEYGCGFGNIYGFSKGKDYWITAEYELQPDRLFKINNNYYIKFVGYNENAHKRLVTGKNLIISGDVITNKKYSPDEMVIIYVPYKGDITRFSIINQNGFEFDSKTLRHLLLLLLVFSPAILFFITWYFFGRENSEKDVPERLSSYPNKRKAWEVASFFNPPFGTNKNTIPALLTDFYQRKIIDIKIEKKKLYVKINNYKENLDNVEKEFMYLLKFFEENSEKDGGYFLLNSSKIKGWTNKNILTGFYSDFSLKINKTKKEYLSIKGLSLLMIGFLALWFIEYLIYRLFSSFMESITNFFSPLLFIFCFMSAISMIIIGVETPILTKFKEDYYLEYRQWQSFKKFLKESPSMKLHGYKGTIIWGEFLVYATAFGVASKVLKEMKDQKIITENQYNSYVVISSPHTLSSFTGGFGSGGASGGGGFGGAGGGGVGGGGGGGR